MTDLSPRTKGTIFHQVVINVHVVNWAHTSATMIFLPEDAGCSSEIHVPTDSFLNSEHQQWPVPFSTKTLPYKRQVMDRNETLLHYSCNISLTSLKPPYIYTLRCSPNIMKPHRAFNITHHMSLYKIYQAPSNNTKIHPTLPRTNVSGIPKKSTQKIPSGSPFFTRTLLSQKKPWPWPVPESKFHPTLGRLSLGKLCEDGKGPQIPRPMRFWNQIFYHTNIIWTKHLTSKSHPSRWGKTRENPHGFRTFWNHFWIWDLVVHHFIRHPFLSVTQGLYCQSFNALQKQPVPSRKRVHIPHQTGSWENHRIKLMP